MADVALPPLPRRQRLAGRGLLLALFLGLLSFAAVSQSGSGVSRNIF
jgi:hypothetical protein